MCLQCFQQVMGRVYHCFACLSSLFDNMLNLHTDDRSIVVVLTPLTAIIQDQVMKCCSEVDKSYIYFQVSSFSSRGLETGSGVLRTPRTPPGYRLEGWPIKITYCAKLAYTNYISSMRLEFVFDLKCRLRHGGSG